MHINIIYLPICSFEQLNCKGKVREGKDRFDLPGLTAGVLLSSLTSPNFVQRSLYFRLYAPDMLLLLVSCVS